MSKLHAHYFFKNSDSTDKESAAESNEVNEHAHAELKKWDTKKFRLDMDTSNSEEAEIIRQDDWRDVFSRDSLILPSDQDTYSRALMRYLVSK